MPKLNTCVGVRNRSYREKLCGNCVSFTGGLFLFLADHMDIRKPKPMKSIWRQMLQAERVSKVY